MMMFPATFGVFGWLQVTGFNANVLNVLFGFLCSHVIKFPFIVLAFGELSS
jgi:hypothetical protein